MNDQLDEAQMAADFASIPVPQNGPFRRARELVDRHSNDLEALKDSVAAELGLADIYKSDLRAIRQRLEERTTERDYHMRVGDQLAANVRTMQAALKEAQRFMSYFAGETGGTFVGPGTPRSCLEQIVAALNYDGHDTNSLTVGEIRRALP